MVHPGYIDKSGKMFGYAVAKLKVATPSLAKNISAEPLAPEHTIARKLTIKIAGLMLPITLLVFWSIYEFAAVKIEESAIQSYARETEFLIKEQTINPNESGINYSDQTTIERAFLDRLNALIDTEKFGRQEKHLLLAADNHPISIPSWLSAASRNVLTTSDQNTEWLAKSELTTKPSVLQPPVRLQDQAYIAIGFRHSQLGWRYFRLIPQSLILEPLNNAFKLMVLSFVLLMEDY